MNEMPDEQDMYELDERVARVCQIVFVGVLAVACLVVLALPLVIR